MPRINVLTDGQLIASYPLSKRRTRVGRDPASNDVALEDERLRKHVSRQHLILVRDGSVRVVDLGSKNGTRLNDEPVVGEVELTDGDVLTLGGVVQLVLRDGLERDDEPSAEAPPTDPVLAELLHERDGMAWAADRLGALYRAGTTQGCLRVLVGEARAVTGARCVWALGWERAPGGGVRYRHLVREGSTADVPAPETVSTSVLGLAVHERGAIWTDDAMGDRRFARSHSVLMMELRAAGSIPIGDTAVLFLAHDRPFGAGQRARLEALCQLARPLLVATTRDAAPLSPRQPALPGVVGTSRAMLELAENVHNFADLKYPVLILGEAGTGKTLIAKAIHELSGVRGSFVLGDCPALNPNLAEDAIFGHEVGAFAEARTRAPGWLERANNGTLFLDEVADLPPIVQPKLLTTLQEHTFEPLGGRKRLPFTARVIAATNRDIRRMTDDGSFRHDLLARIDRLVIEVPPLRERMDDIPALVEYFFQSELPNLGRRAPVALSPETVDAVAQIRNVGNVRGLQSTVIRAMLEARKEGSEEVLPRHLSWPEDDRAEPGRGTDYWSLVHDFERRLLERSLREAGGNNTRAAALVGLGRSAWNRALKRVGLGGPMEQE